MTPPNSFESGRVPSVLIVDDDPLNLKLIQATLETLEYDLHAASRGVEALSLAESKRPDLILLDIMMPGMDGLEVCRRLKANEATRAIPVIFLTAKARSTEIVTGMGLGAVDYVTKPFNPAELAARVQTHVELKRSRDVIERMNEHLREEIRERTLAVTALQEQETYLKTIMDTIQAGVVVIDNQSGKIMEANPSALRMIGQSWEETVGRNTRNRPLFDLQPPDSQVKAKPTDYGQDGLLKTTDRGTSHIRLSTAQVQIGERLLEVQSFLDISDIKALMQRQEMNIQEAKKILTLVNGTPARYLDLGEDLALFIDAVSAPCFQEGGDHFFVRDLLPQAPLGQGRSLISLKDQSGHAVDCILRSILTDLMHGAILNQNEIPGLVETVSQLNAVLLQSRLFDKDAFCTAFNLEIEHGARTLRYLASGHPPLLLIRGREITALPEIDGPGRHLPLAVRDGLNLTAGETTFAPGDKLLLYTDGLTEMPFKNTGRTLSTEDLQDMVHGLLRENPALSMSDLLSGLLEAVAKHSNERVTPPGVNTSDDDVTLIGLEIERMDGYREERWRPANADELAELILNLFRRLEDELNDHGYGSSLRRVRAVLEETALNAWRHAHRENPEQEILIRWRFGNDFNLEVIDQGPGFEPSQAPEPKRLENRGKASGRGIFITRYFSSFVRWREQGRHIIVSFKRNPTRQDDELQRQAGRLMNLWLT